MTTLSRSLPVDPLSGRVGLVLIVLVALAADRAYGSDNCVRSRITGLSAVASSKPWAWWAGWPIGFLRASRR